MSDEGALSAQRWTRFVLKWTGLSILFLVLLVIAWKGISPQLKRYQIETERKAQVVRAESDGRAKVIEAKAQATADRERAAGTADANKTIADSLTDEYIRWLYVDQMDRLPGNSVIYIPTEGGLPILEAGRAVTTTTTPS